MTGERARTAATAESGETAQGGPDRLIAAVVATRQGVRREGGEDRPLGRKAARTRTALLAAAYDVFAQKGYQRTSVADIAEAAGVSLGTFYQYFRDRADILTTIVGGAVEDLLAENRRRWDPARGRLGLRRVIAGFVRNYVDTARFQSVWEEVTHVDPEMAALRRDLTQLFVEAVERGLQHGAERGLVRGDLDPAAMARALTSMVDRYCYVTYAVEPAAGDPPPVEDTVDLLTHLWADAIRLTEPGMAGGAR